MALDPEIVEILYAALSSPFGRVVETDQVETLRSKLYSTRRALGDPALSVLIFAESRTDPDKEIWIIRNAQETSEATRGDDDQSLSRGS